MTNPQAGASASTPTASYNGCSSNDVSSNYADNCNTDSALNPPIFVVNSDRRKLYSGTFAAYFWSQVDRAGDGCWVWMGKTLKRRSQPYGYLWNPEQQKTVHAHRVAWELTHGAIPAGLKVLHRCDRAACVRPACLFLGTQLDNMRDMAAKGRRSPDAHRRKGTPLSAAHRAALSAAQRRRHAQKAKQVA